jgi:tetratricopeptide (TPR) repeat protein
MNPFYTEFRSLMKARRYTEAAALADRQSVLEGSGDVFWLTQLSAALRAAGDVQGALKAAQQAYGIAPANVWAIMAQAEALFRAGRYEEASGFFPDALSDKRTVRRARQGLLYCLSKLKRWKRMLELIDQWELPPGEGQSWRAKSLLGLGKTDDASALCESWLSANPDAPDALWILSDIWTQKEGLDGAIRRFSRYAKIPGKPAVYGEILATLCKRAGRTDDAVKQYGKLLDKKTSPALQRKHAFALAKSGREEEAIPLLEELLRENPSDMYLNSGYIAACSRIGNPEQAWKFYHELIGLHPGEATLYGKLARVRKLIEKNAAETVENKSSSGTTQ